LSRGRQWLSADIAERRQADAARLFGSPTRGDPTNGVSWESSADRLEDAVEFELSATKPANALGASRLHFNYGFRWRSPWSDADKSGFADSRSALHLNGPSVLIQPGFVFPAPLESPAFREHLLLVEPAVPFKFSDGNFKRWIIPPKGRGRYLKPPKDWRKAWSLS
jgi:hypothetical protein